MYTMAADHYDKVPDIETAELYRQKIQMLFIKPQVIACYSVQPSTTPAAALTS